MQIADSEVFLYGEGFVQIQQFYPLFYVLLLIVNDAIYHSSSASDKNMNKIDFKK